MTDYNVTVSQKTTVQSSIVVADYNVAIEGGVGVGISDHGLLTGLGDDDHLQYALLAGRTGGQILYGGVDANDNLTLRSTSHATKGIVDIQDSTNVQPFINIQNAFTVRQSLGGIVLSIDTINQRLGLGTETPQKRLHVYEADDTSMAWFENNSYDATISVLTNVVDRDAQIDLVTRSAGYISGTQWHLRVDESDLQKFKIVKGTNQLVSIDPNGEFNIRTAVNSDKAFVVTNSLGGAVLNVDTVSRRVGINTQSPGAAFQVNSVGSENDIEVRNSAGRLFFGYNNQGSVQARFPGGHLVAYASDTDDYPNITSTGRHAIIGISSGTTSDNVTCGYMYTLTGVSGGSGTGYSGIASSTGNGVITLTGISGTAYDNHNTAIIRGIRGFSFGGGQGYGGYFEASGDGGTINAYGIWARATGGSNNYSVYGEGSLFIRGLGDLVQSVIRGASTQNAPLTQWQTGTGSVLSFVGGSGQLAIGTTSLDSGNMLKVLGTTANESNPILSRITATFIPTNNTIRTSFGQRIAVNIGDVSGDLSNNSFIGSYVSLGMSNTSPANFSELTASRMQATLGALSGNIAFTTGAKYELFLSGGVNITEMVGKQATAAILTTRSCNVTDLYGSKVFAYNSGINSGTQILANLYGHWTSVGTSKFGSANPSVNKAYGYYYAEFDPGSYTLVNPNELYAIYLENVDQGSSLNYAIYTNTGLIRFGDDIVIADGKNIQVNTTAGTKIGTAINQKLGFFNATPIVQPTVTGSRAGNAALASLLTQLANLGLIVDSTTA